MQTMLVFTFIILIGAAIFCIAAPFRKISLEKRISVLLAAVVMVITLIDHRVYELLGDANTWAQSLIHGLQAIALSEGLDDSVERILLLPDQPQGYVSFLRYYMITLYLLAPMGVSALLLKILTGLISGLRVRVHAFRPVYVFSRLNERALTLAESIDANPNVHAPLYIFEHAGEAEGTSLDRLKELKAVRISGMLTQRELPRFAHGVSVFFMDENEDVNLRDMTRLLNEPDTRRWLPKKHTLQLYAFTVTRRAEDAVAAVAQKHYSLRIPIIASVNVEAMLAMNILNRYPLIGDTYEKAQRTLEILLIGDDSLTMNMLETVFHIAQLPMRTPRITVASHHENAIRSHLYERAPMLLEEDDPAVRECGTLRFISADRSPLEILDALEGTPDYVFVSCENDTLTQNTAAAVAEEINRRKLADPQLAERYITVLSCIRDSANQTVYSAQKSAAGQVLKNPCLTAMVGSHEECYSTEAVFSARPTVEGFFLNSTYERVIYPEADLLTAEALTRDYIAYMQLAYNRRSSIASANHLSYRLKALQAGFTVDELAVCESRRWNAYVMMEGYRKPSEEQMQAYMYQNGQRHVCHALRLHPCLTVATSPMLENLWDDPQNPDPLDQLSIYLHRVVVEKLAIALREDAAAASILTQIRSAKSREEAALAKKTVVAYLSALPDSCAYKSAALVLGKDLFRDMKTYDHDIVSHSREISDCVDKYMDVFKSCWIL